MGHQIPTGFRVESAQLKCILLELSSSISTEPPLSPSKLLLPTAQQAATKQAVVMEPECGVLALLTAPETQLCLPTLSLFKNKTKSPTPPSALQHPRHWEGQTEVGGHSICQQCEAGLPEDSQRAGQAGRDGPPPRILGKHFWEHIKIQHK